MLIKGRTGVLKLSELFRKLMHLTHLGAGRQGKDLQTGHMHGLLPAFKHQKHIVRNGNSLHYSASIVGLVFTLLERSLLFADMHQYTEHHAHPRKHDGTNI